MRVGSSCGGVLEGFVVADWADGKARYCCKEAGTYQMYGNVL